ncbi:MAG: DUF11 domain-containing protein [Dehalococcoidia bacterium]
MFAVRWIPRSRTVISSIVAAVAVLAALPLSDGGLARAAGTLVVEGTEVFLTPGGDVPDAVEVSAGGLLGGNGAAGDIRIADGTLSPGLPERPGLITARSLAMTPASTFQAELSGSSPGRGHDQVALHGTLALGGARLVLELSLVGPIGQKYAVITGATSVTGTFANLPEGARFVAAAATFSISYKGGDSGRDVVIMRDVPLPADLRVRTAPSATVVRPGAVVTFTVIVENLGPNGALHPVFEDILPSGLVFQSLHAPADWVCVFPSVGVSGTAHCERSALAAGASATFVIFAKALDAPAANQLNRATISSDSPDPAPANNTATDGVEVSASARPYRVVGVSLAGDGR